MSTIASNITDVSMAHSAVCSYGYQRTRQSAAPLAFVRWLHRWPMNSLHKGQVSRQMFPFNDIIMRPCTVRCSETYTRDEVIVMCDKDHTRFYMDASMKFNLRTRQSRYVFCHRRFMPHMFVRPYSSRKIQLWNAVENDCSPYLFNSHFNTTQNNNNYSIYNENNVLYTANRFGMNYFHNAFIWKCR